MNATKILIIALILIILGAAAYFFLVDQPSTELDQSVEQTEIVEQDPFGENTLDQEVDSNAIVVDISGEDFSFSQDTIEVKLGQTVTINFTSTDGFHDFVIDEFNAATSQVGPGQNSSVTFVADQVGEFEYYCSVMQHRAMGMAGTLIVTE